MATYYVIPQVGGASDSNNGTSTATPWLTIQKAATTMVAGDIVHIACNWTYRELVTPANSGSSGSLITYNFDTKGLYTGYAGAARVTAHDSDDVAATRASALDLNGKTFLEFYGGAFIGGTGAFAAGNSAFASATAYEGVAFYGTTFASEGRSGGQWAFSIDLNAGVTPTTNGIKFQRCVFIGSPNIDWDGNATAHVNCKIKFERCLILGTNSAVTSAVEFARVTSGTFSVGGFQFIGNTVIWNDSYYISFNGHGNTSNPNILENNIFFGATSNSSFVDLSATAGHTQARNNRFSGGGLINNIIDLGNNLTDVSILLGGLHDLGLYRDFGYSPYKPFEPMSGLTGYTNPAIDVGGLAYAETYDMYGNPAKMGRRSLFGNLHYFDASDNAVSDPNAVWINEANAFDSSESTSASAGTAGSSSSNYVFAGGTNAPSSGGTINKVQVRMRYAGSNATSRTVGYEVYTDGLAQSLGSFTETMTSNTQTWGAWKDLSTPTGGWSWAAIQALEIKFWEVSGGANVNVYKIEIGVVTEDSTPDIGAVESNHGITKDTTTVIAGSASGSFAGGAGFEDYRVALGAGAHSITVKARYNTSYTGTLPSIETKGLVLLGTTEQIAYMTAAADTEETLTLSFTTTSAGEIIVRLRSYDTSASGGKVTFDTLRGT